MIHQLRSELLKLRTTRTAAGLMLAAAGVTLLGACVEGLPPTVGELAREQTQRAVLNAAGSTVVLFATLVGLLAVTSEFRYGTIRPTLLVEPRRRVVLASKLLASASAGVVSAIVCVGVAFGAGLVILRVRDVDLALSGSHTLVLLLGPLGASALGAILGVAVGTLIRNQAGALITLAAYAVAVDAVLFAAVPSVGRFTPGKAGDALVGRPADDLLTPGAGAAVLVAWALAFIVAATVRNDRGDI